MSVLCFFVSMEDMLHTPGTTPREVNEQIEARHYHYVLFRNIKGKF